MLDIERTRLTLSGRPPAQVNLDLRWFAEFYVDYLSGKLTPGEVVARKPHLRGVWPDASDTQYGRHARFYHAVAELNVEEAWARLAARRIPALLVWGEYDWIMSRAEQERAIAILNANEPGLGTPTILPGVDHGLMSYASMLDAFHDRNPVYRGEPGRAVNDWLRAWSGDAVNSNVLGDPEAAPGASARSVACNPPQRKVCMPGIEQIIRSFDEPDEVQVFEKMRLEIVRVQGEAFGPRDIRAGLEMVHPRGPEAWRTLVPSRAPLLCDGRLRSGGLRKRFAVGAPGRQPALHPTGAARQLGGRQRALRLAAPAGRRSVLEVSLGFYGSLAMMRVRHGPQCGSPRDSGPAG